jgi:hypothetical protein
MPAWGWVVIIVAAVIVVAALAYAAMTRRRSTHLRETFGSEYDRAIEKSSNRREAEAELSERERRRQELDIRPLSAESIRRYSDSWQRVTADFVDSPATAVTQAESLVVDVMRERGYPMDDFDQRASDISVDHPEVVGRYREGHRISQLAARGSASTEDLRQAMQHYRELFRELLEPAADEPTAGDRDDDIVAEAELDADRPRETTRP